MSLTSIPGMSVFSFDSDPQPGTFKCSVCPKLFKRSEHRLRHERSHTNAKPYACRFCSRIYSRNDLVLRHERTVHAVRSQASSSSSNSSATSPLRARGSRAPTPTSAATSGSDVFPENEIERVRSGLSTASSSDASHGSAARSNDFCIDVMEYSQDDAMRQVSSFSAAREDPAPRTEPLPSSLEESVDASLNFFDPFLGATFDELAFPRFGIDGQGSPTLQDSCFNSCPTCPISNSQHLGLLGATTGESSPSAVPQYYSPLNTGRVQLNHLISSQVGISALSDQSGLVLTGNTKYNCIGNLKSCLRSDRLRSCLPPASSLQNYFATYVKTFHVHFPFLHVPTLDLAESSSPLILAVCAVGALYRLERKVAAKLAMLAQQALADSDPGLYNLDGTQLDDSDPLQDWTQPASSRATKTEPLALSQARLVLTFFEAFSGQPRLAKQAFIACGYLGENFRSRMSSVKPISPAPELTWHVWAERESVKRLLCGCLILSNLLIMTYGLPPGFAMAEESDIEIPDDEALWQAQTASEWAARRNRKAPSPTTSLREAVSLLFDGKSNERQPEACSTWSSFTISAVMHGVAIAIWFLAQGRQACSRIAQHDEPSDSETRKVEAALSRCTDLLSRAGKAENTAAFTQADETLLFNAFSVLRASYNRAFINVRCLDKFLLLQQSNCSLLDSLRRYRDAPQGRDKFMTLAVARALEGFAVSVNAGMLLVRKSAALTWSLEHPLAAWDAGLLITKWLHTVERAQRAGSFLSSDEKDVIGCVKQLLDEVDIDCSRVSSLAAELARVWASLYDDTWVWGVTPRIGCVLRELARIYEESVS